MKNEYSEAQLLKVDGVPLEELEQRFLRYTKLTLIIKILPYFIQNRIRISWWRKTLVMTIPYFYLYYVDFTKARNLLVEKNKCYGNKGLHSLGTLGIAVRSMDKIYRVMNIRNNSHLKLTQLYREENLRDSIMDLGNYCVLAILLCEGRLD